MNKLGIIPATVAIAAAIYFSGFLPDGGSAPQDKTVLVATGDAEMNAARDKARDGLPFFWSRIAAPGQGEANFALKLGISDGSNTEHFWCAEIEGNQQAASCRIANDPEMVKTVKAGQRVAVDPEIISDWMYQKDGKIKGGETIRVLVARMPAEEAAQYNAILD